MDHIVYLDAKAKEFEKLSEGSKTMIIRGAAGRKLPHGRVSQGDILQFINNNAEGLVKSKATVESVLSSEKMNEEEPKNLVMQNQRKLNPTDKQIQKWAGRDTLC